VAILILGFILLSLIAALIAGKVPGAGEDFGAGFFVSRTHNPYRYWFSVIAMAVCAIIAGLTVAANYGIDIVLPGFKL
jgi:amino acid transporter